MHYTHTPKTFELCLSNKEVMDLSRLIELMNDMSYHFQTSLDWPFRDISSQLDEMKKLIYAGTDNIPQVKHIFSVTRAYIADIMNHQGVTDEEIKDHNLVDRFIDDIFLDEVFQVNTRNALYDSITRFVTHTKWQRKERI